ncbi:haloacid dehalogenase [Cnuibacter physcomitrellae]|uniref:HAD family hydrolase n=1 Tax=Cnuibacter physcomitrellae TaxID=1619308 RepID=A0A1X9LR45_9MICO|nr:HAD family hydrolase [Cnuibacter physcomitrellae]ARJ06401.1 HAD family hydrolase [Cnuibacter physcomitrellae]GGI37928.1 haloacid dehalogenase [Cnuibacter physcomitrellae]
MDLTSLRAVLFDIDGTLIDSNYLHVESFMQAFDEVGVEMSTWRVHRAIGLDSSRLMEELLGDRADEVGDEVKEAHSRLYRELWPRLRRFDGARELLETLHGRGIRVVLATSAPEDELEELLRVLDCDDVIHATTNGDDVETAKPEPDILGVALERAGVAADEALMVGDARWDAVAAGRAGVRMVGVRSGGISEGELRDAGALEVHDDVAALLRSLS